MKNTKEETKMTGFEKAEVKALHARLRYTIELRDIANLNRDTEDDDFPNNIEYTDARTGFRVYYNKADHEFRLETSYSNQIIDADWIDTANKLYSKVENANERIQTMLGR